MFKNWSLETSVVSSEFELFLILCKYDNICSISIKLSVLNGRKKSMFQNWSSGSKGVSPEFELFLCLAKYCNICCISIKLSVLNARKKLCSRIGHRKAR